MTALPLPALATAPHWLMLSASALVLGFAGRGLLRRGFAAVGFPNPHTVPALAAILAWAGGLAAALSHALPAVAWLCAASSALVVVGLLGLRLEHRFADTLPGNGVGSTLRGGSWLALSGAFLAALPWYFRTAPGDWVTALAATLTLLAAASPLAWRIGGAVALAAGAASAAEAGVELRGAEALERLGRVNTLLLDKTGTLTSRPRSVAAVEGQMPELMLALAAAAEGDCDHPVAGAVRAAASERQLAIPGAGERFELPGYGVRASVGGRVVRVGSARFLEREGLQVDGWADMSARFGRTGLDVAYVTLDAVVLGVLGLRHEVSPGTRRLVWSLGLAGTDLHLVSGDSEPAVRRAARRSGIRNAHWDQLPEDKADLVARLQARGRRVAFVGDGNNDAAALARADVGIATGGATDQAVAAADLGLGSGGGEGLLALWAIAARLRRRVGVWRVLVAGYHLVALPLAAAAPAWPAMLPFAPPVAALMALGLAWLPVLYWRRG